MYQAFSATRGVLGSGAGRPPSGFTGRYVTIQTARGPKVVAERMSEEDREAQRKEKEARKAEAKERFLRRYPPSQRAFAEEKFDYLGRFPPEQREQKGREFDVMVREREERARQVATKPAEPPAEHSAETASVRKAPETQTAVVPVKVAETAVAVAKAEADEGMDITGLTVHGAMDDTLNRMLGIGRIKQAELATMVDALRTEVQEIRKAQAQREELRKMQASGIKDVSIGKYDPKEEKKKLALYERAKKAKAKEEAKKAKAEAKPARKPRAKKTEPKPETPKPETPKPEPPKPEPPKEETKEERKKRLAREASARFRAKQKAKKESESKDK